MIKTTVLFFVYTFGIGYTLTFFTKNSKNFLERNTMRIGIGLSSLTILAVILNLVRIPLDWRIFLALSLIVPAYALIRTLAKGIKLKKPKPKISKTNIYALIAITITILFFLIYVKGAFVYPYLEDDDPWAQVLSTKYVAQEKTLTKPEGYDFQYLDPYPPGYSFIMGLLHQTNNSISTTLKFFNALIISLAVIFFYFFMTKFTDSHKKALFSTFILATIPCFLGHFIWSHTLIIPVFFVTLYSLEMQKKDKKWVVPAAAVFSGMMLVQPTQILKLCAMLAIYFIVNSITTKKIQTNTLITIIAGTSLSMLWWATRWRTYLGLTIPGITEQSTTSFITKAATSFLTFFKPCAGSATRAFALKHFLIAEPHTMINNPLGIGIALSILTLISLAALFINYKKMYGKENAWMITSALWLVFTFIGVNTCTFNLPIGLYAFRFWMLLAIPVSIIGVIGLTFLLNLTKRRKIKITITALLILGILLTSGYQKYTHNTSLWPPGVVWTSLEELRAYIWLKNLPPNTKIFTFTDDATILGFDKYTCAWCPEIIEFKKEGFNQTTEQIHAWLKQNQYSYLILGGQEVRTLGYNQTNTKILELDNSTLFEVEYYNDAVILFKTKKG